jgi:hypothetical protein
MHHVVPGLQAFFDVLHEVSCMQVPFPTIAQALKEDGVHVKVATGVLADGSDAHDDVLEVARQADAAILCAFLCLAQCWEPSSYCAT